MSSPWGRSSTLLRHACTLLLSDGAHKLDGQSQAFSFVRSLDLQMQWIAESSRHSSILRRVAFTTKSGWKKGEDGMWYLSELPSDRPVEHSGGDDDDNDNTNDDGSISDYGLSNGDGDEDHSDSTYGTHGGDGNETAILI